eukprot:scaffold22679_cov146-Cylindrotheca_fusiformis.AAC.1
MTLSFVVIMCLRIDGRTIFGISSPTGPRAVLEALPAEGGIDEEGPTRRLRSRRGDWNSEGRHGLGSPTRAVPR